MEYILGVLVGLIYGGLVGFLKYILLWKKMLKVTDDTITMNMVTARLMLSYLTNAVTLVVVFLVRNIVPLDFISLAVSTAVALSLSGKAYSMQDVLKKTEM